MGLPQTQQMMHPTTASHPLQHQRAPDSLSASLRLKVAWSLSPVHVCSGNMAGRRAQHCTGKHACCTRCSLAVDATNCPSGMAGLPGGIPATHPPSLCPAARTCTTALLSRERQWEASMASTLS